MTHRVRRQAGKSKSLPTSAPYGQDLSSAEPTGKAEMRFAGSQPEHHKEEWRSMGLELKDTAQYHETEA